MLGRVARNLNGPHLNAAFMDGESVDFSLCFALMDAVCRFLPDGMQSLFQCVRLL